jgi:hypothetical protein
LTAIPQRAYPFTGWSGSADGKENLLIISMDANKNIIASFIIDTAYLGKFRHYTIVILSEQNQLKLNLRKDN